MTDLAGGENGATFTETTEMLSADVFLCFSPCKAVHYENTEKYMGSVCSEVLKTACIDNIFTL